MGNVSRYKLVYVTGSGRCGSTLLDLMLNGHSQVLGLGELSTVNTVFDPLGSTDAMVESFQAQYRSFWQQARNCFERRSGESWNDLSLHHGRWRHVVRMRRTVVQRWGRRNRILLSCLHEISGLPILTDASKWPQRLSLLRRSGEFDIYVIHLIRDGRAVTNSYVQRYNSFAAGLRVWLTADVSNYFLRRRHAPDRWLTVRYEDLARDPEATLAQICQFLAIDYEPGMLSYRSHAYFGVGGNPLTKDASEEKVTLDERWRSQLQRRHRVAFAMFGAWMNFLYGYGRPRD